MTQLTGSRTRAFLPRESGSNMTAINDDTYHRLLGRTALRTTIRSNDGINE